VPDTIHTSVPSIARVYDAVLGGKDNYEVDRAVMRQLLEVNPDAAAIARDNRAWLVRVVRHLANEGIDQFLDCGSGLPTAENTHQVLARTNPAARVLYVDNDPIVLAHGRALLTSTHSEIIDGDVREPQALLAMPRVRDFFDWSRPIGLLQVGILHHVVGDVVFPVMDAYRDAMPAGSFMAISHFYNPRDGSEVTARAGAAEAVLLGGELGAGEFRSRDQIERLFGSWDLLAPGLSFLAEWWPEGPPPRPLPVGRRLMLAGVAAAPKQPVSV
jgi:hypothetical protein